MWGALAAPQVHGEGVNMSQRAHKALLIVFLAILATGCKISLTVTSGGDVPSLSGTNDCAGASLCEYEVNDMSFAETFTAVPREGYVFSKWQGGDDYLCPNSPNPICTVENGLLAALPDGPREIVDAIIASGRFYYLQPLFTFVGIDTDGDGIPNHIDTDDDNDGVLDPDDDCPLQGPNLDGSGCPGPRKTVFVTSERYTGNLGGLTGADQKCNALAAGASLSGTYKAWLSTPEASPDSRFVKSAVPYVTVNDRVVADDWLDLIGSSVYITTSETGVLIDIFSGRAWTGTKPSGEPEKDIGNFCAGPGGAWSSSNVFDQAAWGVPVGADFWSTAAPAGVWTLCDNVDIGCVPQAAPCSYFGHLYCFEQ